MSITQPITRRSPSDNLGCPRCKAPLPAQATFCGVCGERIDTLVPRVWEGADDSPSQSQPFRSDQMDIATRYRITSLVRRRPYVNLFFALDNRQQRMVAIRDIDISSLDEEIQRKAIELVESEYDLLRRSRIPHVTPVIDLRHFQDHIFVIGSSEPRWEISFPRSANERELAPPASGSGASIAQIQRLYTLQDLLQSGIGLPAEQVALDWVKRFCKSLDSLHGHQIVVGDLDPYTIISNTNSYEGQPALMVSWLPPELRDLLPRTSTMTNTSYFSAPEALLGNAEPRSDIYSLGAILYLLLTGTPPDEPDWRNESANLQGESRTPSVGAVPGASPRQRLRSVRELNPHISSGIDECIMRALSMEPAERFQNGEEMAEALDRGRAYVQLTATSTDVNRKTKASQDQTLVSTAETRETEENDEPGNVDTVRIIPLSQKNLKRWQSSRMQERDVIPHRPKMHTVLPSSQELAQQEADQSALSTINRPLHSSSHESLAEGDVPTIRVGRDSRATGSQRLAAEEVEAESSQAQSRGVTLTRRTDAAGTTSSFPDDASPIPSTLIPGVVGQTGTKSPSLPQRMKLWVTSKLPALKSVLGEEAVTISSPSRQLPLPGRDKSDSHDELSAPLEAEATFLKQIQRFVLGQQRHTTMAAAIIETPLRVQPNQEYAIRLHLIGRDEINSPPGMRKDEQTAGLSALLHGDQVFVEVRSALHQNFAYIVQQASVRIPANGYEAEVTIPMQPLSMGPSGRRDRLHIFFLDEHRRPLYEKPFVVEIFISHLVQPGREGHNVLTLPY